MAVLQPITTWLGFLPYNMTVYVTQKPPAFNGRRYIDLSPAKRFGELVYLSNRVEVEEGSEQSLLWKFRERMKTFDSRLDYILPLGHTMTMAVASIVAVENGNGTIRIMQWNKLIRDYAICTIDVHAQPEH